MLIAYYIFPPWVTKKRRSIGEWFGKTSTPLDNQSALLDYLQPSGPIESIWLVPGTYTEQLFNSERRKALTLKQLERMREMRNDHKGKTIHWFSPSDAASGGEIEAFYASGYSGKSIRADGKGSALKRGYWARLKGYIGQPYQHNLIGPYKNRSQSVEAVLDIAKLYEEQLFNSERRKAFTLKQLERMER